MASRSTNLHLFDEDLQHLLPKDLQQHKLPPQMCQLLFPTAAGSAAERLMQQNVTSQTDGKT